MGDRFMSIRMLVWVLLIGATCANAAPPEKSAAPTDPKSAPPAAENVNVDALARAKDVDAKDADTNAATKTDDASSPIGDQQAPPTAAAESVSSKSDAAKVDDAATSDAAHQAPMSPLAPQSDTPDARLAAGCEARATSILDAAQKGDYAAAVRDFDAKMRSAMPAAKFKQDWESLAQFGALQARGQSHLATSEGYLIVTIPLIFEKANLYAQIDCGSDGRIAGFHVKPLEVPGK
jgi:hypothetical protein